jgi:hypothetical protein
LLGALPIPMRLGHRGSRSRPADDAQSTPKAVYPWGSADTPPWGSADATRVIHGEVPTHTTNRIQLATNSLRRYFPTLQTSNEIRQLSAMWGERLDDGAHEGG